MIRFPGLHNWIFHRTYGLIRSFGCPTYYPLTKLLFSAVFLNPRQHSIIQPSVPEQITAYVYRILMLCHKLQPETPVLMIRPFFRFIPSYPADSLFSDGSSSNKLILPFHFFCIPGMLP